MTSLRIAGLISIGAHVVLVVALLISGHFSLPTLPSEEQQFEPIINAKVIDESVLAAQRQKVIEEQNAQKHKQQELAAEARRQREREQAKIKEQAKQQQLAEQQAALAAQEKKKQEIAKAKKLEAERKRKAAEKLAAEKKAQEIKEQRERQERELKEAERKRQEAREQAEQEKLLQDQLQAEQAARQQRRNKQVLTEVQKYQALIKQTIQRNLIVDDAMKGKVCRLNIRLASNGLVIQVKEINGDAILCRAAKAAVFKSDTLPVSPEPDVYQQLREINLTVEPEL